MSEDILVTTHVHGCMQNFTRILPRNPSPVLWIKFFVTECLKTLEHKVEGCRPVALQMIIGALHRKLVISMHGVLSASAVTGLF